MSRTIRVFAGLVGLAAGLLAQSVDRQNPLWQEFGLQQVVQTKVGDTPVTAYQLKDPTGATAAFQWLRSQGSPEKVTRAGNYVVQWPAAPDAAAVKQAGETLPKVDRSSAPALPDYLPRRGRVAQSERYSLGEASLKQFEPRLPAAAIGFDKGAEVEVAQYRQKSGATAALALVLYPTPQIARLQAAELEKLPGVTVRRKSSLVSLVLGADERAANQLIDEVRYRPVLVTDDYMPKPQQNPGVFLIEVFVLAGILIGASVVMGLFFGGFRRFRAGQPDAMILLHLSDK